MRNAFLAATAIASLVLFGASNANAVTMKLTFNGTVSSSGDFDIYNTFGTGGSLAGQSATMSFLYNANIGDSYLAGISPSPVYSMSLTINGNSFTTSKGANGVGDFGAGGSALRNDIFNVLVAWGDVTYSNPSSVFNRTGFYAGAIFGTFFSPDLTTSFSKSGLNCADCGSFIAFRGNPSGTDYFLGKLNIDSASLSVVPVPAALPLLATAIVGLGAVGARRRKRKVSL